MKKSIKNTLIISASILFLFLISLFTIPLLFKEKIKGIIVEKINDKLNANLSIGRFNTNMFSNFPDITLSLEDVALAGVQDFASDTLMQVKSMDLSLSLYNIIKGDYVVKKILLDDADIYVKKNFEGRLNWDIIKSDSIVGDSTTEIDLLSGKTNKVKFRLQKVSLKNCNLVYEDQKSKIKVELVDWNSLLSGNMIDKNENIHLTSLVNQISFSQHNISYLSKSIGKIDATMNIDLEKKKLTFIESVFHLNDLKILLDGSITFVGKNVKDFDLKLTSPDIQFKNVLSLFPGAYTNNFKEVQTQGDASLDGYIKGVMDADKDVYPSFQLKMQLNDAMFKYPSLSSSIDNINIGLNVSNKEGSLDNIIIDIDKFNFRIGQNPFYANLNIQTPITNPDIKVHLNGSIDLGMIKNVYPIDKSIILGGELISNLDISANMADIENEQYNDIHVNGGFSINKLICKFQENKNISANKASLEFNRNIVNVSLLKGKVGDSDLSAEGKLQNFIPYLLNDKNLKGKLSIKSDYFNLNSFIPITSNQFSEKQDNHLSENHTEVNSADKESDSHIFIIPANIDLLLDANLKQFVYAKTDITNLGGMIVLRDGIATFQKISAIVFGGKALISGSYITNQYPEKTRINISMNLSKASFNETFKSSEFVRVFVPVFQKLSGDYSLNINLNTTLNSNVKRMLSDVTASGTIKSNNVKIEGARLLEVLASSLKIDSFKTISVKNVDILFIVENGKVETKPFSISIGDGYLLNLGGTIDLDQNINYKGSVTLPKDKGGIDSYISNIPLTMTGTFTEPKISVDTKSVLNDIAGQLLSGSKKNRK